MALDLTGMTRGVKRVAGGERRIWSQNRGSSDEFYPMLTHPSNP